MLDLVVMEDVYKQKISDVTYFAKNVDKTLLAGVIQGMEEKLEEVSRKTIILDAKTEQVTKQLKVELPVLFAKTGDLDTMMGTRVKNKMTEFVAPTLWSSIALLTTIAHKTQSQVDYLPSQAQNMKNKLFQELYLVLEQKLAKDATDNSNQVSKLGGMLASSVHQIGNRIQQESERTDFITNKPIF
jgi:hypothetical protein